MLGITEFLGNGIKVLLSELWKAFKQFIFLFIFVGMLMAGIALKNILIIIITILGLITSVGALVSDRGTGDTTYIIKGKRIPAKNWLKKKEIKSSRFTAKAFWGVILFILGLLMVGYGIKILQAHIIIGMFTSICGFLFVVLALTIMCRGAGYD